MSETKVSEPKQDGNIKVRKVRRNRKNYGEIRYYNKGVVAVYWSSRRNDQFHRLEQSWLFEADTISAVRNFGITHVGIHVEDGTVLLTRASTFTKEGMELGAQRKRSNTYVDPFGNRGAMCWYIPMPMWSVREPPELIKHEFVMREMHLKRARIRKSSVTV